MARNGYDFGPLLAPVVLDEFDVDDDDEENVDVWGIKLNAAFRTIVIFIYRLKLFEFSIWKIIILSCFYFRSDIYESLFSEKNGESAKLIDINEVVINDILLYEN